MLVCECARRCSKICWVIFLWANCLCNNATQNFHFQPNKEVLMSFSIWSWCTCSYVRVFFSAPFARKFTWKSKVSRLISFHVYIVCVSLVVRYEQRAPFNLYTRSRIFYCIWRLQSQENKLTASTILRCVLNRTVNMNVNDAKKT